MSTVMTIGKRVDPKMKFDSKSAKRMTSFTVYALISDINELSRATYLDNREFYYISLDPQYRNIIEMIAIDIAGQQFELVTRKLNADRINFIDTTSEINAETFMALKSISQIGFKHKYLQFPIPGTEDAWEVSVFLDHDGHDILGIAWSCLQMNPQRYRSHPLRYHSSLLKAILKTHKSPLT